MRGVEARMVSISVILNPPSSINVGISRLILHPPAMRPHTPLSRSCHLRTRHRARGHVRKTQCAARLQHPPHAFHRGQRSGNGAQRIGQKNRINAIVFKRNFLAGQVDKSPEKPPFQPAAWRAPPFRGRFQPEHHVHLVGIVKGQVQP